MKLIHLRFAAALAALAAVIPCTTRAALDDVYVVDIATGQGTGIFRITPGGTRTLAYDGLVGAIVFDSRGNLYVTDSGNIIKIRPNGTRTTFGSNVGAGALAFAPDGKLYAGTATTIFAFTQTGTRTTFKDSIDADALAFDAAGNLYVGDTDDSVIYKLTPDSTKSIFANPIPNVYDLAVDKDGFVYASTQQFQEIKKISPAGNIAIFTNQALYPTAIDFNEAGELYVCDQANNTVKRFAAAGGAPTTVSSNIYGVALAVEPRTGAALNISTRARVQTGDDVLIGGFIIDGAEPKKVIIRGIGPSLSFSGVAGAMQDPVMEFYNSAGQLVTTIDNWKESGQQAAIQQSGVAPSDDREPAGIFTLAAGAYTAVIRGKNNGTGIGLVEVYDLDQGADAQLVNISTRGRVETGDNVLIGGFILGASGAKVLVRAIGPSLSALGVNGAMADPTLSLRDSNGNEIAKNDDWQNTQGATEIQAKGLGPTSFRESAILRTLPAGNYTAIVAGFNGGTGVAAVEAYNLN